jgi:hypothetical protein
MVGFNSGCEERLYAEFCGPAGGEAVGDEDNGAFDWAAWEAGSGAYCDPMGQGQFVTGLEFVGKEPLQVTAMTPES